MSMTIVVSAIALQSGGTLSILQDCIKELSGAHYRDYSIYVILKSKSLLKDEYPSINFIEVDGTRSYLHRWYYEYYYFRRLSITLNAHLWFSLHDLTPAVQARRRAVYCHNPSPFYTISWREFRLDPKFGLFTWVYWILYKINIGKNNFVVVQQTWLRQQFAELFTVDPSKIIVAHPNVHVNGSSPVAHRSTVPIFFYPALPRVFKNLEVICKAVELLQATGEEKFEVVFTIDGTENRYARELRKQFGHLHAIRWMGQLSREKVFEIYSEAFCLIFPSKLETWGLPISEFKHTGKPIILAEKPYARETAGHYDSLIFFDPDDSEMLSRCMRALLRGDRGIFEDNPVAQIAAPAARNWSELFKIMLSS